MTTSVAPVIGGINSCDFGLKAGFWNAAEKKLTFRPIVGWAIVANYMDCKKRPLVAVVLDDQSFPVFASPATFPNYAGVYRTEMSEEAATKGYLAQGTRPPSTGGGTDPLTPTDPLE